MIKRKPRDLSVKTYLKELLKNLQSQDNFTNKKVRNWIRLKMLKQNWRVNDYLVMSCYFTCCTKSLRAGPIHTNGYNSSEYWYIPFHSYKWFFFLQNSEANIGILSCQAVLKGKTVWWFVPLALMVNVLNNLLTICKMHLIIRTRCFSLRYWG